MKRKKLLAMGMFLMLVLGGCGNPGGPDESVTDGMSQESSLGTEQSVENSVPSEQSQEDDREPEQPVESSVEPTEEAAELTDDEKQFFTDFIQEKENYGFLLSDYDVPRDVNIGEVFYGGAGFGEEIPEEDIPIYLEAVGEEELYLDCVKMTRPDIEEFLQRKLGLGLEDMSSPLDMVYVAETDSYYNQAGDTNYAPFSCTGGTREGDTYRLHFTPAADWLEGFGDRETILVKTENDYRFLSNHTVTE